jgi:integrase
MPPVTASAPSNDLHAAYLDYLQRTGRGNHAYFWASRVFFARWPDPRRWAAEPLDVRLSAGSTTRPVITFLMLHRVIQPGYDYLLERKLSSIWREISDSPLGPDLAAFMTAAADLGFTQRVRFATGSQVPARLLIQTGRRLDQLTLADLATFTQACQDRQERTGKGHHHYLAAVSNAQRVLFHLGIVDELPRSGGPVPFAERLAAVRPPIRAAMIAYLERKRATCQPKTVSAIATRLRHFGEFLAQTDPALDSIASLDRRRHIEPYLTSLTEAVNSKNDELITVADRSRRVLAVMGFLTDITEWGWPEAPARKLLFRDDNPRLPQVLPRYLPVDADRRLTEVLASRPGNELAACALRLQRCCGLRIGELLDLELDCVHQVPGHGSWLKIPLGKLETERMVPLDDDILQLIDRIIEVRSHGRPMPHPRYRRPAQFLFTHHGRRLSQNAVRAELNRAAQQAGLGHITPHQLRHTYATALEMGRVASGASFRRIRECAWPAVLFTAG